MESSAFDVFQGVKNYLYLGDYSKCIEELSTMDIDEDDLAQKIKRYFYKFIVLLETQKDEEINSLLSELKQTKEKQLKIYFNLFLFYVAYMYKGKFDEKKYENFFNELKDIKKFDSLIFPAVYILGLLTIQRENYQDFLTLIDKFSNDLEILGLKFSLMLVLNKRKEMDKIINIMNVKDPDAVLTQLCNVVYGLYASNDWENAINKLKQLSGDNVKIGPKIFNLLGVSLMSKGAFEEALKIMKFGKDMCEKNADMSSDYNCLLVNLIACCRNMGKDEEIKGLEETLKKNDENNLYFKREETFEEMFNREIKELS